ncbi:MAG TPA: hypothetical protein VFI65_23550 [Streptosporangiaceae bacterium]|nr:hypothetical protein [Streptosporangiaceae bacterium]
MPDQNICHVFAKVTDACADREAIIWRERLFTYCELRGRATRLA